MSKKSEKKQMYQKPKLEKYGDISIITKGAGGLGGDKDGMNASQ
jgi:hypothetical protein